MKKLLAAMFVALLMVGCGDPGEKVINVFKIVTVPVEKDVAEELRKTGAVAPPSQPFYMASKVEETIMVRDLYWRMEGGVLVGTRHRFGSGEPRYQPADEHAVKAISDYGFNPDWSKN